MNTWTVFKNVYCIDGKKWIKELIFYKGDSLSFNEDNFDTDWRFCEVKDKRKKSILIGDIDLEDNDFPIKYPLMLKNGIRILDKNIID